MIVLAGDDPVRMQQLEKEPILSYWALLNKKLKDAKRMSEAKKKSETKHRNGRRGNH